MSRSSTYFFSRVFLFFLINVCALGNLIAQVSNRPSLGVSFPNEINEQQILSSIPELQELGIQVIELQHPVTDELIAQLSNQNFQLLLRSDIRFLTQSEIDDYELIEERVLPIIDNYAGNPNVSYIGLTSYSASFRSGFIDQILKGFTDSSSVIFYEVNNIS